MEFKFTTSELPPVQAKAYWNELVCKRLVPADGDFGCDFRGELTGRFSDGLTICQIKAGRHSFERRRQHLSRSPDEHIVAAFLKSGRMDMVQGERSVHAKSGDILLYDSARTFFHDLDPKCLYLVKIPRGQLLASFKGAEAMMGIKIASGTTMGTLLQLMVEEFFNCQNYQASGAQTRFASAFIDTLSVAMEFQSGNSVLRGSGRYSQIYQKALEYIDENLDSPELSLGKISTEVNISPRTLSRIFASFNRSVMEVVLRRRLARAFKILTNEQSDGVSCAAYRSGFTDLSHFSKSFRAVYGFTAQSLLQSQRRQSSTGRV